MKSLKKIYSHKFVKIGLMLMVVLIAYSLPAFAATDVWSKAQEVMKDVYGKVVAISTVAAVVTSSIALLLISYFYLAPVAIAIFPGVSLLLEKYVCSNSCATAKHQLSIVRFYLLMIQVQKKLLNGVEMKFQEQYCNIV